MEARGRQYTGQVSRRSCPDDEGNALSACVVHRAVAMMRARINEPLSVARIATECGTSNRTLYRALRREQGLSPMALLRQERLAMVRAELSRPAETTTVTLAAVRWGFDHLGRFSRYYARQFGELPSETLRRARLLARAVTACAAVDRYVDQSTRCAS